MYIHDTCSSSIKDCLNSKKFAIARLFSEDKTMDIHVHDCCEIYYSVSGAKQFLIDNRIYTVEPGDIFFINPFESHYLSQIDPMTHSRIVISVHPDFLRRFSTPETDINYCFVYRDAAFGHKIALSEHEKKRFLYYIHILSEQHGYGQDILDLSKFLELMIFLNDIFIAHCSQSADESQACECQTNRRHYAQIDEILQYINAHISEKLTLADLSSYFHLSGTYICKIFKEETGTTIAKYIIAKRISHAKILLSEGRSVTDVCYLCGFSDYSNFIKAFTKTVGVSPKKYGSFS